MPTMRSSVAAMSSVVDSDSMSSVSMSTVTGVAVVESCRTSIVIACARSAVARSAGASA